LVFLPFVFYEQQPYYYSSIYRPICQIPTKKPLALPALQGLALQS